VGRLRGPSSFLLFLAVDYGDGINDDLRHRPLHFDWSTVGFDRALILAINQFPFEENVIASLNPGRVVRSWPIGNTGMPLRLFLPLLVSALLAFGGGDRKLCHASAVLRRTTAGIFTCEARQCYAIDSHKSLFLSEMDLGLRNATPA
jgi:hypothetical protein